MIDEATIFRGKAEESLTGAESEFANGRFSNCANRCYYACFQAAIAALRRAGIHPGSDQWSHSFVQSQFVGLLINRRKQYPSELRDVLSRTLLLRQTADYQHERVSEVQASRALRRARQFLTAIQRGEST